MIATPLSSARPALGLRLLRYAVAFALAPAVTVITVVAMVGCLPVVREVLMTSPLCLGHWAIQASQTLRPAGRPR